MSLFKGITTKKALSRLQEEQVYEFILDEIEAGQVRRGLMAKAMTLSNGDESKWQGEYIKLRFQSLIDENTLFEAINEIEPETKTLKRKMTFLLSQSKKRK